MVIPRVQPSVKLLKEVRLLKCFSSEELEKMIQLAASATYEPHSNIVIEGELSWGLYLILEGMVGVYKTNKLTGDIYDVGQLREGQFFGEMSLIDDKPRSATVKALTDCSLMYISKDNFSDLFGLNPEMQLRFYRSCVEDLVVRFRELDESYVISQYQLWKTAVKKEAA